MLKLIVRSMFIAAGFAVAFTLPASALRTESTTTVAFPLRGAIDWQVLLCDFSDTAAVATKYGNPAHHPTSYYQNLFFTSGTGGLQDYIKAVSFGAASVTGSVHGWIHESGTYEAEMKKGRGAHFSDCVNAAIAQGVSWNTNDRVYVFTSPGVDIGGFENEGAIGQDWAPVFKSDGSLAWVRTQTPFSEVAHEFGHAIGLGHSFSNDLQWLPPQYGADAEYDNQFDLMSSAHIFTKPGGTFGGAPPFLDVHHIEEMGWMPRSRIITVGAEGINSRTIKLAALTHSSASGDLVARVLFDNNDQFHYYTVEYRIADGWDSGWANVVVAICRDSPSTPACATQKSLSVAYPNAMIMINEVQDNDISRTGSGKPPSGYSGGSYYTSLLRQLGQYAGSGDGTPDQSLSAHGVTISVVSMSGDTASVKITTKYQPKCASGYTPREATAGDEVCVTPKEHAQAIAENGDPHRSGQSGCRHGYVRRGAYDGDTVCVTPAEHTAIVTENEDATLHVVFNEYGPLKCREGYVWRQADDLDYVCVTPATRQQTASENAASKSHSSGSGCRSGYAARKAYPGDSVCVTPSERSQAESDNGQTAKRILNQAAFAPAHMERLS